MSNPVERIRTYHTDLTAFRRDLHAHPELAFEEARTSQRVASPRSMSAATPAARGCALDLSIASTSGVPP